MALAKREAAAKAAQRVRGSRSGRAGAKTALMREVGVYVHFPYCLQKCPYCDFASVARPADAIEHELYADAVERELGRRAEALEGRALGSVFFGGGTPSLWAPAALGRVLSAVLGAASARAPEVEVTVECNPSSLDEERARALLDVGVNRLSIGLQGLDDRKLERLGRLHDARGGVEAVRAALRAGAPRVSADLIYGVLRGDDAPSPAEAAAEARQVAELGVSHVSAYCLTIEQGTPFGAQARRGVRLLAPEDALVETGNAVRDALEAEGLRHYEVSNYARPGDEARHNMGVWLGGEYVGLGCAAVGMRRLPSGGAHRYKNLTKPEAYLRLLGGAAGAPGAVGALLVEEEERLDAETLLRERIMLGLRLRSGFDLAASAQELGVEGWTPARRKAARRLEERGRLRVHGDWLDVPESAWMFTDGVAAAMF